MRGLFGSLKKDRHNKKFDKILEKAKEAYDAKEYEKAFSLFSQAAALQSPEAQYWIGMCYINGYGVIINLRTAASWHEMAAIAGWVDSQYMLAILNMNGLPKQEREVQGTNDFFNQQQEKEIELIPDLDAACYWAHEAAKQDFPDGQALYAYLLFARLEHNKEALTQEIYDEILMWYDKSIVQQSPQGYMGKGLLLFKLANTDDELAEAAELLEKAAEHKMGTAIHTLGIMYDTGKGVPKDMQRAVALYKEAAELGIPAAQALYGRALKDGDGVEQNLFQAETWLRKAALKNDVEAAVILADMNVKGHDDIPPNYAEAIKWYSFATQHGHAGAASALGLMTLKGIGISQSLDNAIELFKKSADKGYIAAIVTLGDLSREYPEKLPVDDVINQYLIPISNQNIPIVHFNLALSLLKSSELNRDLDKEKEARRLLEMSCEQFVPSRYWYGRMCIQGIGGDVDIADGYKWISSAAGAGFVEGELLWANILLEGYANNGGPMVEEALKFYHSAANKGNVLAMFALGAIYGGGNHIEPDRVKAQEWFIKAAQNGHVKAQLMLGRYLSRGLAGTTDLKQAQYWLTLAKQAGEKEAAVDLQLIEEKGESLSGLGSDSVTASDHVDLSLLPEGSIPMASDNAQKVEVAPGLFFIK